MPHGKQPNHKLKPYVVFQYLLKYTDENHVASASEIKGFLEECGLNAERRSYILRCRIGAPFGNALGGENAQPR